MDLELLYKNIGIKEMNAMQKSAFKASDNQQDIVLLSPTGSGKTLAFLIPILRDLKPDVKGVQCLILVPARELALQIESVFKSMKVDFKVTCCYGGHNTKIEQNTLVEAPAVLIGTPGRIAYHLRNENFDPAIAKALVLDEFDKALELGFQEDMSFIINQLINVNHRILTSATEMQDIPEFVGLENDKTVSYLKNKEVKPDLHMKLVNTISEDKLDTLFNLICKIGNKRMLIFCNHRDAVDRISNLLNEKGIARESFHGGMEQDERERALLKFRNDSVRVLITTDLAARGLDIPEVDSIIHYQLPPKEAAFIHRNGRTARMNAKGSVYLIISNDENFPFVQAGLPIENLGGTYKIPVRTPFQTIYISAGKKDKINKVDIVGFLFKKGNLEKQDIGIIEVKDNTSYVAINRQKVPDVLKTLNGLKLKNKKVKMQIAY
ncbi:Superfamily II DNA and RNA helicase [Algoriella xinjiangensis]|uniref:Superfamily II DNA and RNA helicase n=1 Tax=Algoriella xinjiangensis TaxID=684065 RepID=A0A1I4S668_9FLAO|nr:DEAD/DEAH box helicase [Algoriella xinjiangensis]SFM59987.1 Superfamily II DNA and RNA helicase [Algoriella xinjiangensis]VDH15921.1 ATP-dependent RNA helicase dbpA [Algoriella xinjiangensis]